MGASAALPCLKRWTRANFKFTYLESRTRNSSAERVKRVGVRVRPKSYSARRAEQEACRLLKCRSRWAAVLAHILVAMQTRRFSQNQLTLPEGPGCERI
jgi:hypothetical protein